MTGDMRYVQRGGYTPAEQQRRERPRLEAAGRSARGDTINKIAHDLRVARRGRRPGQHRRGGVLPARRPAAPVLPVAAGRRRMGEAKGFTWQDYRDLIIATITTCQPRSLVPQ